MPAAHPNPLPLQATACCLAAVSLAVMLSLAGCGGGGEASSSTTTTDGSSATSFPTGLTVGSPADLTSSTTTGMALPADGLRYAIDWGSAAWKALTTGDGTLAARLATALLPLGSAYAATVSTPDLASHAALIERVLSGHSSVDLADVLDLQALFTGSSNASCYGPSITYAGHQDASGTEPTSGQLPGGDLGLWTEYEGGSEPCVAAQLSRRVAGVKARSRMGLLLVAAMRHTVASTSTLSMPAAGASTDLSTEFETLLRAVPALASVNVRAATVALDASGATYTYRLVLDSGSTGSAARSGEVVLSHSPGTSATEFSGLLQVAAFTLDTDAAFGCSDAVDSGTGRFQRAHVSTLKYSRAGAQIQFGSRDGHYCGHPSSTLSSNQGAEVAAFAGDGQLDPADKLSGSIRGSSKGWRGNFSRFAGHFDKTTVDGNFLYAWQAGGADGNARALAMNTSFNTASEVRSLQGFFGFTADIGSTDGSLLGMICNWAGPGNSHTPTSQFQSQAASLAPSAMNYTVDTSKITYAPTTSCSSTTTEFDVNANNTLASGEGLGTAANLDVPSGSRSVQDEIDARGYARPAMF